MEENTKIEQSLELDAEQLQAITGGTGESPIDQTHQRYLDRANAAASIAEHGERIGSPLASAFADLANQHAQVVNDDIQHENAMNQNSRNRSEAWKIVQQQKKSRNPFTCCFKG